MSAESDTATAATHKKPGSRARSNFVKGLVVLFPMYFTFLMIQFLIRWLSKPLTPAVRWVMDRLNFNASTPVTDAIVIMSSLTLTLIFIGIVGAIAQKVIGRKTVELFERILEKVPVIRTIYKTFREITRIMTGEATRSFQKTVYIDLPEDTGKVLGFITGSILMNDGRLYHSVFVPTTPNITTGFLLLLRPEQIRHTHLSPEEGLRFVLSAGVLSNHEVQDEIKTSG
ncbi:DUF502 domain-containing protein [bacterium]|nr:DUF502 domain-containing protein [candidate division CSSED10-310 bacterium]